MPFGIIRQMGPKNYELYGVKIDVGSGNLGVDMG